MKLKFLPILLLALLPLISQEDPALLIDPRIGNLTPLMVPTYPTFHLPHQMIRMYPVTTDYHYTDDQIMGFPLQVVAHREAGIFQMKPRSGLLTPESWQKVLVNDKDLEILHPWHYSTRLVEEDIAVQFAPGKKSAIYRVDFPKNAPRHFLFQGTKELKSQTSGKNGFQLEEIYSYLIKGENRRTKTMSVFSYAEITDLEGKPVSGLTLTASEGRCQITLGKEAPASLLLRYGISYIDALQAKKNFELEAQQETLETLSAKAKKAWDQVVGQIEVQEGSLAQRRSFYTALYRTNERMVDINEYGRYFSGYDDKIHESDRPFYIDDWIWDTFRAMHPLKTILSPELEGEFLHSYTEMYRQSGWLPTFPEILGNHLCMNAYHSTIMFVDAYRKGIRNFDVATAYEGLRKNMTEATWIPWRQGTLKTPLDNLATKLGYYPALRPDEKEWEPRVDGFEKRQPVAVTLGRSYDAWALAQFAKELGKKEDYSHFMEISRSFEKLWHPEQRLFLPKDEKGEWILINPKSDGGKGYRDYYDENNGWTYAWDVAHNIPKLTELLGGKKAAEERLDQLFREPLGMRKNMFYIDGANSTGLVGQFSMGNEPSFHIPYLYNYFGAPWKTQKWTRRLLELWFSDTLQGIPGDEDGGGMSSFVLFTSLGFYPVTTGSPIYTITSPIFEKSVLHLSNKKSFTLLAPGSSPKNKYIQKILLNGKELDVPFITHEEIMAGGTLTFTLGELPNKTWGTKGLPSKFNP